MAIESAHHRTRSTAGGKGFTLAVKMCNLHKLRKVELPTAKESAKEAVAFVPILRLKSRIRNSFTERPCRQFRLAPCHREILARIVGKSGCASPSSPHRV